MARRAISGAWRWESGEGKGERAEGRGEREEGRGMGRASILVALAVRPTIVAYLRHAAGMTMRRSR